ncbi:MAG: molybdopterin-dependent oxidoreductase [Campylobacteraceae bacterium]|nr:molybdopterin-dependent oxidoreductase [Campylobacteraceae bacterium]
MTKKTTCPLDCFDSCSVILDDDGKLKGDKTHPITQGYLCHHLNNYHKIPRIKKPIFQEKEISLSKALEVLVLKLKETKPSKVLYYKGSGNLGALQSVTRVFFDKFNATLTKGGLCEKAGIYGIEEGRGAALALSPAVVKNSDVVIIWGRDTSITNSHMLPALKGKKLIVIDPRRTNIAKKAEIYVQIKPRCDIHLAMLLSRVAYMEQMEDADFIKNRCENFDYFLDEINGIPMVELMQKSGVDLDIVGDILGMIKDKKVSILVGIGVQKYSHGHSVLRSIDSFAALLGLFGKDGCGVGFIDDSSYGFGKPFAKKSKNQTPMPTVDFGDYDVNFIQGGNPMTQHPCTPKVKKGFEKSKFVVYFGLFDNQTAKIADLIIPAKSFLEKEDIKLSYGHEYIGFMPKLKDSEIGISEYELSSFLMDKFGFDKLKSEAQYIKEVLGDNSIKKNNLFISKYLQNSPYTEKFYTDSEKFEFFDEFDADFDDEQGDFYLLTVKQNKSLNSQFFTNDFLYVPASLGLKDGDFLKLGHKKFECKYEVRVDENLRNDCFALHSGGINSNMLTPSLASDEGDGAIYQEIKVNILQ